VNALAVADGLVAEATEADSDGVPLASRFVPAVLETDRKFCGCFIGHTHGGKHDE
jgi:hypothetical protein